MHTELAGLDFRPGDAGWYLADPHAAYRRLRREAPVYWYEPDRFWFLSRHADVLAVSKDPATCCSGRGFRIHDDVRTGAATGLEGIPPSILGMDPPDHTRYRGLVSSFFTPRSVHRLEQRIREMAYESLDAVETGRVVDFVELVSVPLPVLVIAELLGVPLEDQKHFRDWSDDLIAANEGNRDAIGRVAPGPRRIRASASDSISAWVPTSRGSRSGSSSRSCWLASRTSSWPERWRGCARR